MYIHVHLYESVRLDSTPNDAAYSLRVFAASWTFIAKVLCTCSNPQFFKIIRTQGTDIKYRKGYYIPITIQFSACVLRECSLGCIAGSFHKGPLYELHGLWEFFFEWNPKTKMLSEIPMGFAWFYPFWVGFMKRQDVHQVCSWQLTYFHKYLFMKWTCQGSSRISTISSEVDQT